MFRNVIISLVFTCVCLGAAAAEPPAKQVGWSSDREFQARFEKERENHYYPSVVEGRLVKGNIQYRGEFHAFPPDMEAFMVRWGLTDPWYAEAKRELDANGFEEISHSTFLDAGGNRLHQVVWMRHLHPFTVTDGMRALHAREAERWAECRRPVEMLLARRFAELDSLVRELQKNSGGGLDAEQRLSCALLSFDTTDARVTAGLDDYVTAMPDSWVPRLLRAVHQTEVGWYERGCKWASETSEEQFAKMQKRFDLADADIEEVLRRAPEVAPAYQYRIIIDKAGAFEPSRDTLDAALKNNPGNLAVRQAYMVALLPRWGGSLRNMEAFAREHAKAQARFPWLKVLDGMIYIEQGETACERRECGSSLAYYERALQVIDYPPFHASRGEALANLGRDAEALEELDRALSERPFLATARDRRASLYAKHGLRQEAADDYQKLLQVFPGDADYLAGLNFVTTQLRQTGTAAAPAKSR